MALICHRRLDAATGARRISAFIGKDMAAIMTVNPQQGWMKQVGEFRFVVLPEARGKGPATALADRAVVVATEMELRKLYVEVLESQRRVIDMFTALGFEQQAVLVTPSSTATATPAVCAFSAASSSSDRRKGRDLIERYRGRWVAVEGSGDVVANADELDPLERSAELGLPADTIQRVHGVGEPIFVGLS